MLSIHEYIKSGTWYNKPTTVQLTDSYARTPTYLHPAEGQIVESNDKKKGRPVVDLKTILSIYVLKIALSLLTVVGG